MPPLCTSITACRVDELAIIGQARGTRGIGRVCVPFSRGRDTEPIETQNPPRKAGLHIRPRPGDLFLGGQSFPYLPDFRKPLCVHWRSAPKVNRFRAGCAATPEVSLRPISAVLPALPGFPSPQTRSLWPVWRNSVVGPVRFAPISRKTAARLWHAARRWDRETRQPGRPRRHHRPHRSGGALRAPIRLPEPQDRAA